MSLSPFIVVEGPQGWANGQMEAAVVELTARGWTVAPDAVRAGPGTFRVTHVDDRKDAEDAVLSAAAGVGLVVRAGAPRHVLDALYDDLRHLGWLEHRVEGDPERLDAEQWRILELLAQGRSLAEAAAALHLSRRSADRRISAARAILGASSTGAAVAAARQLLERVPPAV